MDAILHNLDKATKERFPFLAGALIAAWRDKATGYIVTPENEVIKIRKGKRPGIKKGQWVPCNADYR